jgi:hypothetical protein
MFGFEVPHDICAEWAYEADKEQLVTEAELYPVVVASKLWKDHFTFRRALVFVDSEPAKHCLIRGTSNVETCAALVQRFYEEVDLLNMFPWFSRVPSMSNPADLPSRLDFISSSELFGAELVDVPTELIT